MGETLYTLYTSFIHTREKGKLANPKREKGELKKTKREKRKGGHPVLGCNSTRQPDRAHACTLARTHGTTRNGFLVGLTPQPPICSTLCVRVVSVTGGTRKSVVFASDSL